MYRVQLDQFEGPLDLLLFFIKRDELDVYDIPIAQITDEFLAYVQVMEEIDLDGVGDFLYFAALLISIKARMLLPSAEVDEEGEPIDPRQELVERLLEYMRYKEASLALTAQYEAQADYFVKGRASGVDQPLIADDEEWVDTSVFDLINALRRMLVEAPATSPHAVERESYALEEQFVYLRQALQNKPKQSFRALVDQRTKPFIITTFLAVLELARQHILQIKVGHQVHDFFVERGKAFDTPPEAISAT